MRRLLCETEAGQDPGTEFELVTWGKGGSFSRLSIDKTSRLLELDDLQEFASQ